MIMHGGFSISFCQLAYPISFTIRLYSVELLSVKFEQNSDGLPYQDI